MSQDQAPDSAHIHIIEDEEDLGLLVKYNLKMDGYYATLSNSGERGLEFLKSERPDLIILDIMLPGVDGLSICKYLKSQDDTKQIPIIIMSAKGEEEDVVKGLELGADDYVPKPFSPKVLLARVKAVLRRQKGKEAEKEGDIKVGEIYINPNRHEVTVAGEAVDLTNSEFQILALLARRPGWVFTRMQIVDAIRGENYAVTDRTIDFQMVGLRKKLGAVAKCIETVRGVGYRLKEPGHASQ